MSEKDWQKVWHNDAELTAIIREHCPEMTGAGQSLLKYEIALNAVGSSISKIIETMRVTGSPFLKLPNRD